jgi:hypothetical protein
VEAFNPKQFEETNMRIRLFTLVLALACALAQVAPVTAQQPGRQPDTLQDWAAVQTLSRGEKIVVRLKEGNRLSGRFDSANDLVLNFTDDGRQLSLTRESIQRVQLNRGKSRLKGAAFGAAIGAGAGLGLGSYAYYSVGDFTGSTVPGFAVIGAGIGAGIGAAFAKGNKNETIYEAP